MGSDHGETIARFKFGPNGKSNDGREIVDDKILKIKNQN